jgi:hypothetical protein
MDWWWAIIIGVGVLASAWLLAIILVLAFMRKMLK